MKEYSQNFEIEKEYLDFIINLIKRLIESETDKLKKRKKELISLKVKTLSRC